MNKVILIGNLTRDVELNTTPSGLSVAKFSLAVQRKFKGADGVAVTDFFNIVAWRDIADNCAKFLSKGNKAAVVGNIQMRSYDGEDGNNKSVVEVIAEEVEFLTPRNTSSQEPSPIPPKQSASADTRQTKKKTSELKRAPYDDGLPF